MRRRKYSKFYSWPKGFESITNFLMVHEISLAMTKTMEVKYFDRVVLFILFSFMLALSLLIFVVDGLSFLFRLLVLRCIFITEPLTIDWNKTKSLETKESTDRVALYVSSKRRIFPSIDFYDDAKLETSYKIFWKVRDDLLSVSLFWNRSSSFTGQPADKS